MDTDDVWNSFFGGSFESMAKRMERVFSELENLHGTDVKTYGYTMYRDSDGNRHMREYGNSIGDQSTQCNTICAPLTDVSLEDGVVRAVVEIPGVSKEDIVLEGTKNTLFVNVDTDDKKFSRALALPCDVDPDSAKAEYNNGILEVTLTSMDRPESKKHIDVQ
jgi:HSP20 family protein